jgi:mannose-1-phosphate guanylyltransferase/mannose-6-phosphate isomerase
MCTDVVILAGGFGERLWPASSSEFPKQFMRLEGGLSFLQQAIDRAWKLSISGHILLVIRQEIEQITVFQVTEYAKTLSSTQKNDFLSRLVIITEPCSKHTCPPLALATRYLQTIEMQKEHTILVLTSDHIISPQSTFEADVELASKGAKNGYFTTFGIQPTEAATGFGYINVGKKIEESFYKIDSFKEKPDSLTAEKYLAEGHYWWNSGMFCFTDTVFFTELTEYQPEMADCFPPVVDTIPYDKRFSSIKVINNWPYMNSAYSKVKKEAIDTAIAEKTSNAAVVKAHFNWKDIGSWDSFAECFTCHDCKKGEVAEVDTENCFVYSDIPVALCGVKNIVVVVKNNQVLVMEKGKSHLVKEVKASKH